MASPDKNVLIFGPAGGVGCAAAIEAHRRGAHVWLAMRDTSKTIEGLKDEDSNYTRIQADLSKPETLKHAVQQSGATTAFVYVLHGAEDHMRASFDALKEAGITYAVLLSSYSVHGSASEEANMKDFIPAAHARTEVALEESGIPSAAVRPAYFNTNIFWFYGEGIKKSEVEVEVVYPDIKFDFLSPADIGTVCGALLVKPQSQNAKIPLCGPELLSQRDAIAIVARTLDRDLKVKEVDEARWYEMHNFMPKPVLDTLVNGFRKSNAGHDSYPNYDEAAANIKKHAEREPTKFADWVKENKGAFQQ